MLSTDTCGWDIESCDCTPLDLLREEKPDVAAAVEAMAANHLFRWTGSRFGPCPVTVRPCRSDCRRGQVFDNGGSGYPVLWQRGLDCGCRDDDSCSCGRLCEVALDGPIVQIDEVKVDGEILDPSAYRIDDARMLVRIDSDCWPTCNDLSLPDSEGGTWSITYRVGLPIPPGGQTVAGILACEMAKAVCRDSSCSLPKRIQSLTREGVTMAMIDDFSGLANGHTGLWIVDSWIDTNRPITQHASVWSPDVRPRPRVTG